MVGGSGLRFRMWVGLWIHFSEFEACRCASGGLDFLPVKGNCATAQLAAQRSLQLKP